MMLLNKNILCCCAIVQRRIPHDVNMWQEQKSSKRWTGGGGYVTDALITFDVICDLLLNNPTATQNLFVNYMIKKSQCR